MEQQPILQPHRTGPTRFFRRDWGFGWVSMVVRFKDFWEVKTPNFKVAPFFFQTKSSPICIGSSPIKTRQCQVKVSFCDFVTQNIIVLVVTNLRYWVGGFLISNLYKQLWVSYIFFETIALSRRPWATQHLSIFQHQERAARSQRRWLFFLGRNQVLNPDPPPKKSELSQASTKTVEHLQFFFWFSLPLYFKC